MHEIKIKSHKTFKRGKRRGEMTLDEAHALEEKRINIIRYILILATLPFVFIGIYYVFKSTGTTTPDVYVDFAPPMKVSDKSRKIEEISCYLKANSRVSISVKVVAKASYYRSAGEKNEPLDHIQVLFFDEQNNNIGQAFVALKVDDDKQFWEGSEVIALEKCAASANIYKYVKVMQTNLGRTADKFSVDALIQ